MARSDSALRTRLGVDERRAQLLELGLDLFSGRRYDEISIEEVAERANVSVGLVYHYFGSKHGFYVEVVRAADLRTRTATEVTHANDGPDLLHQALLGYLQHVRDNAAEFVTIVRGAAMADPDIACVIEESRRMFIDRIVAVLDATDPDPVAMLSLQGWVSFVEETAIRWVSDAPHIHAEEIATLCHKMSDASLAAVGLIRPRVIDGLGRMAGVLEELVPADVYEQTQSREPEAFDRVLPATDTDETVDILVAADRLEVSVDIVERLIEDGALEGTMEHGRWRVSLSSLPR